MSSLGNVLPVGTEASLAYIAMKTGTLVPSKSPRNQSELETALRGAETHPNAGAFEDAMAAVRSAVQAYGAERFLKTLTHVEQLAAKAGTNASIGDMFLTPSLAGQVAAIEPLPRARSPLLADIPTPSQIVKHLDQYVWGQELAKKVVANAVYQHLKRAAVIDDCKKRGVPVPEDLLKKVNILLAGPTGVGKTLIAQTIAKLLDVPFAMVDANSYTEAGYVGEDVEAMLLKLVEAAGGDVEKAQRGILFIDEFDKKRKPEGDSVSITRDVSGAGVQQMLLKIVEGGVFNVPPTGGRKHPGQDFIKFDTSNVLFIGGGAFSGIEEIWKRRMTAEETGSRPSIGFGGEVKTPEERNKVDLRAAYSSLEPADLVNYGMMRELVGRFPAIAGLLPLTVEDLAHIITTPRDAIAKQYKGSFAAEGVELDIKPDAIKEIARRGLARGTGGRGLQAIFEQILRDPVFQVPDDASIKRVVVGASLKPRYVREKAQTAA